MRKTPALKVESAGQSEGITADASPTALDLEHQDRIDPRLAFLLSSSIRFDMVERGLITIDEAISPDFIESFRWISGFVCYCEFEIMQNFDRIHREMGERWLRGWRWRCRP